MCIDVVASVLFLFFFCRLLYNVLLLSSTTHKLFDGEMTTTKPSESSKEK